MSDCLQLCGLQHIRFSVLHYLLKFAQIHVHWVGDDNHSSSAALFSFYFQSCPASRYLPMSWLFTSGHQNIGASTSLSFQWIFRVDSLWDWLVGSPCCPRDSQESSPTPQFKSIKIPHTTEQLGPCTTTTEAHTPRACAPQQKKPLQWRVGPLATTRESVRSNRDPVQSKVNKLFLKRNEVLTLLHG